MFVYKKLAYILYAFLVLFVIQPNLLFGVDENSDFDLNFQKADVQGTFVLYDVEQNKFEIYNNARSIKRYSPASTFKITNSLIGLATGTLKDVEELVPYIGPDNPFIPEWKRDMGLREAIKLSNVPIYQELARRIGLKQMKQHIVLLNYGNENIGEHIDRFWLDGTLQISALEQVLFLTKLAQKILPYSDKTQQSIHDILLLEQKKDLRLYGKTGWQNAPNEGIGWFVGWLEKSNKLYIFALNIDIKSSLDAKKRVELSRACLVSAGLLLN